MRPVVSAARILALSGTCCCCGCGGRAETLYAFFGIGGVVWSLHSVWGVLPDPFLPHPHFAIWWNLGFRSVAPIVVFCIRLAQGGLPRVERALWLGLVLGPPLVYAAYAAGQSTWRATVAAAAGLRGRPGERSRSASTHGASAATHSPLLGIAGATAFAFGLYATGPSVGSNDNNPVLLTHFAGLVFFPLVASMLIDGFVRAADDLERLNADLERRVADKSAELRSALESMRTAKEPPKAPTAPRAAFSPRPATTCASRCMRWGCTWRRCAPRRDAAARDD